MATNMPMRPDKKGQTEEREAMSHTKPGSNAMPHKPMMPGMVNDQRKAHTPPPKGKS